MTGVALAFDTLFSSQGAQPRGSPKMQKVAGQADDHLAHGLLMQTELLGGHLPIFGCHTQGFHQNGRPSTPAGARCEDMIDPEPGQRQRGKLPCISVEPDEGDASGLTSNGEEVPLPGNPLENVHGSILEPDPRARHEIPNR